MPMGFDVSTYSYVWMVRLASKSFAGIPRTLDFGLWSATIPITSIPQKTKHCAPPRRGFPGLRKQSRAGRSRCRRGGTLNSAPEPGLSPLRRIDRSREARARTPGRTFAAGKSVEVTQVRITHAGRRALAERQG